MSPRTWRRYEVVIAGLALTILREAAIRSSRGPVQTVEVRLALHVLRPMVSYRDALTCFWKEAEDCGSAPWKTCHAAYAAIVDQLVAAGVPVDEVHRR